MDNREQLQQQMLELIYGLLSDQESAELVERISSDGQLAREYAELKERTELLAEVTKATSPLPNYDQWKRKADEHDQPMPSRTVGTRPSRSRWVTRSLQVVSGLAACLLIAALAYPKLTWNSQQQTLALQQQSQSLADDYLSLSITGPSLMATEVRNEFLVSVENAANQPVDAQVEYWFKSPANETVYYGLTEAKNGQVVCQIPADEVSSAAKLEVIAKRGDVESTLGLAVKAAPPKPVAILQTDRTAAQPGETVNFRAVVIDPQNQQDRSANVDFLWSMQNNPTLNRIASAERSTLKGVAQGQMTIPATEPPENLELTIESVELQNNLFQREVPVISNRPLAAAYAAPKKAYAYDTKKTRFAAKPEGGNLVAGVENQLYYSNQVAVPGDTPARTQIRSADDQAQVPSKQQQEKETAFGVFNFVPQSAEEYTVEVLEEPKQADLQQSFVAQKLPATLRINNGVAPANEPLEIDVRVAIPNTTMALIAGDDYATIGHNVWDVGVNAPITQPVKLNLPTEATGAQRVRLYSLQFDETGNSQQMPELIAERIVYRIPVQRYKLDVQGLPSQASPGEQLSLQVAVKDEYNHPAQATLGVQMERLPAEAPATQLPLGLEGEFLLNQRVALPSTANNLPEDVRQLEQDRDYFDQVLVLSDWKNETAAPTGGQLMAMSRDNLAMESVETNEPPVVRRTNRKSIQSKYQQALAVIHQQWQARLDDVHTTSRWMLVGGAGILAVGLIGLAVVQGRRKMAVWLPGLVVAFGSILWGLFSASLSFDSLAPSASSSPQMVAVSEEAKSQQTELAAGRSAVADTLPSSDDAALRDRQWTESNADAPPPQPQLRSAGPTSEIMNLERSLGGAARSRNANPAPFEAADRYSGMENQSAAGSPAPKSMAATISPLEAQPKQTAPQSVLWQPRLTTNANGEVNLPVTLPATPGRYRLVIDAHGSGRLGTLVRYIEVGSPPVSEPASPAND
ncbi:hypothetical protein DTL42_08955 [Bremerella cremea]|uniref:Uncharacterized protein n=1 Tax=Bremerella cremea TaxID=1031537 RepID=A0A368KTI0_9BACT|nr:hypothetical protein [Bremerella cremea]RCS52936.1 hypothetical protein DTL42_08955 [Bremerella cremea]